MTGDEHRNQLRQLEPDHLGVRAGELRSRRLRGHDHPLGRLNHARAVVHRPLIVLSRASRDHRPGRRRALAAPASGSIGIRLVDRASRIRRATRLPARTSSTAGARDEHRAPGRDQQQHRMRAATVAVYPAAASLRRGTFMFASGHSTNELSRWTSAEAERVPRWPPGTKAFETVTINVPTNASAGERYAVIWAEVSARPLAAHGVRLVNRVGVRMYVSVGSGGAPPPNSRSAGSPRSVRRPGGRSWSRKSTTAAGARSRSAGR